MATMYKIIAVISFACSFFSVDAYNCWMGSPDKLAPRECPAGSDLCTTEQKDGAASYGCNKTDDLLPRFDAAGATAPDLSSGWACLTVADVEYCACNTDSCLPRAKVKKCYEKLDGASTLVECDGSNMGCVLAGIKGNFYQGCFQRSSSSTKMEDVWKKFPTYFKNSLVTSFGNVPNACVNLKGKGGQTDLDAFICKCSSEECNVATMNSDSGSAFNKGSIFMQVTMLCISMSLTDGVMKRILV